MTRREEIIEKAQCIEHYGMQEQFAFIAGAQWADKTMIEKVEQWLNEHMYCTPIFEHDEDENPVNYVCASCCDSVEEFIENFRKAMEE